MGYLETTVKRKIAQKDLLSRRGKDDDKSKEV